MMRTLIDHNLAIQLSIYGFTLLFFWFFEVLYFSQNLKVKFIHSFLNAKFLIFVLPIQITMSLAVFYFSNITTYDHWGIFISLFSSSNSIIYFISSLLIIDFFDFIYHIIMHKVPFLWRFHEIHHSDRDVDISTTIREHPGETLIRLSYLIIVIMIFGISPTVLIVKQFFDSTSNLASHTKYNLPKKLNNIISLIFVTPNTHHIHHHYKLPYTDSNYGNLLTIWDRFFSTFLKLDSEETIYGVDSLFEHEKLSFNNLIITPFKTNSKALQPETYKNSSNL